MLIMAVWDDASLSWLLIPLRANKASAGWSLGMQTGRLSRGECTVKGLVK